MGRSMGVLSLSRRPGQPLMLSTSANLELVKRAYAITYDASLASLLETGAPLKGRKGIPKSHNGLARRLTHR